MTRPADLGGPEPLASLHALWCRFRRSEGLPSREELDVFALRPWLGFLSLVEPLADGGFRYRVFGSELAGLLRREMTGRRVDEMASANMPVIEESYRLCLRERLPVYSCHDSRSETRPYRWHRLLLPLARPGGGEVRQILAAAYPLFGVGEPMERGGG